MPYTCTKTFDCVSTAHRNWRAATNPNRDSKKCSYIHGYTKTFTFVFGCESLDEFQWVYDYGTTSTGEKRVMTRLKEFIQNDLDHGVTTDSDDPMIKDLLDMHHKELIKLVVIPVGNGQSGSVEGLARFIHNTFNPLLLAETNNRVWIESVTISEHHKNSSTYTRPQPNETTINAMNDAESKISAERFEELKQDIYQDEWIQHHFGNRGEQPQSEPQAEEKDVLNKILNDLGLKDEQIKNLRGQAADAFNNNKESLEKLLTKENLDKASLLLKLHPKGRALSATIDVSKKILEANPDILNILKGKTK